MSDTLRRALETAAETHHQARCPVDLAAAIAESSPAPALPWRHAIAAAALVALGIGIGLWVSPNQASTDPSNHTPIATRPKPATRSAPTLTLASSMSIPKFDATLAAPTSTQRKFRPSMPKLRAPQRPRIKSKRRTSHAS